MPRSLLALKAAAAAVPLAAASAVVLAPSSRSVLVARPASSVAAALAPVAPVRTSLVAAALKPPAAAALATSVVRPMTRGLTLATNKALNTKVFLSPAARLHVEAGERAREYLELCATEQSFGHPHRSLSDTIAWMECGFRVSPRDPFGPPPMHLVKAKVDEGIRNMAARSDAHPPDFDAADLVRLIYLFPPVPYVPATPTVNGGSTGISSAALLTRVTAKRVATAALVAAAAAPAAAPAPAQPAPVAQPPPPPGGGQATNPKNRLPRDIGGAIQEALRTFKWWIDQGGKDDICFWSENHQILFASSEYLAGQLMPNTVFSNTGWRGSQHKAAAKRRILKWLDERLRFGFSEWNSPGYYEEDFKALFNLVDFADDAQVRRRAAMVLDLLVFDLARNTVHGSFGVTAGRSYEKLGGDGSKWKTDGWQQKVGELIQILFGTRGRFHHSGAVGALGYATSVYQVPTVLLAIGKDRPDHYVDRSRVSVGFDEAPDYGIGFRGLDDAMFWWGKSAYLAKNTVALTRWTIKSYAVSRLGADIKDALGFAHGAFLAAPDSALYAAANAASPITEGMCLTQANLYNYKNKDVMLSSVQDYRRGQIGPQQHIWQATLGMKALVYTTLPGKRESDGPGYWTGNAAMPSVVQHEDALICGYDAPFITKVKEGLHRTHAWFPVHEFDETDRRRGSNLHGAWGVTKKGTWLFGRKGNGYVAIYSNEGWEGGPTDWVAKGSWTNVFVCQVGSAATFGSFQAFKDRVTSARIYISYPGLFGGELYCGYDIPGKGRLELHYGGRPRLNGQVIDDRDYPRFDNKYCYMPFGLGVMGIRHDGYRLIHVKDTLRPQAPNDARIGEGVR